MNYLKRLQSEVDHIASLCDEAALLQRKLEAAVHRLDSLELEHQGFMPVSLQEMRDIDGVNYESWGDFVKKSGPYLPESWGGRDTPRSIQKQIDGRRDAALRWERDLGLPGIYPVVLEALVAAHHLDPNAVQPQAGVSSENEQAYRLLITLDMARGDLGLALPLPSEIERAKYFPRVRRLIVVALKSRLEIEQNERFIQSFFENELLVQLLGRDRLENILRDYVKSHRVDGYVDLSEYSLLILQAAFEQERERLYWHGFREPEIKSAIEDAVSLTVGGYQPTLNEVRKLVEVVANNKRLRELLVGGYRTTDDWYRRHPKKI